MNKTMKSFGAFAFVALGLAACATPAYNKGNATAASFKQSAERFEKTQTQLEATITSLSDLTKNPQADLRPQYKAFSNNVDALNSSITSMQNSVSNANKESEEYLTQWSQDISQIQNEDIRKRSNSRKEDVTEALEKAKKNYAEINEDVKPLMSDLRDIQKYLGNELNPTAVNSIKKTASKVDSRASKLKSSIGDLSTKFKKVGESMSAIAEPAPETKTK